MREQRIDLLYAVEHALDFFACEHYRQVLRWPGSYHSIQPRQVDARHLPAQEWQSRQSLVPGRSRHLAFDGKRCQEDLDFASAHLAGMTLAVKENESLDRVDILCFSAYAVMAQADLITHLVEKLGWGVSGFGRRILRTGRGVTEIGVD
jgi:hypothetical protein